MSTIGILSPTQLAPLEGSAAIEGDNRSFHAWLSVKGVRDIASGLFLFIVLVGGTTHLLGWFMLAAGFIPVGDAVIVLRSNGPKAAVYGIHGATAVVMLAISALLLIA